MKYFKTKGLASPYFNLIKIENMEKLEEINKRLENIEIMLLTSKTVLTFDEASDYTGLSKSHLYRLTSTGGIPFYKPKGKIIYFDRKELDNWMLQNRNITQEELEIRANTYLATKKKGGRR